MLKINIRVKKYIPIFILIGVFLLFIKHKISKPKKPIRVYASMVGDLLHFGHAEFLRQAKGCGDYLIVGLISDEVATSYKRKPILTLEERMRTMKGCKYVDEVIGGTPLAVSKDCLANHVYFLPDRFDVTLRKMVALQGVKGK